MSETRDISLDLLKAIGIIAVVAGHYNIAHQFVYSFHMPLFFVVGGYLFRQRTMATELKTDIGRLLVPYLITSLCILIWDSLFAWHCKDRSIVLNRIIEIVAGGGTPQHYFLFGDIGQIGAIWFLLALMICRLTYNVLDRILQKNALSLTCLCISVCSILIHKYMGSLPWDILQGLSALVFYDAGRRIKDAGGFEIIPYWIVVPCIAIWIVAIAISHISIASCTFRYYPIDFLGAMGAIWLFWKLCAKFSAQNSEFTRKFAWLGKNSLAVLCLHLFDLETGFLHKIQHWTVDWHYHNDYLHAALQLLIIVVLINWWNKISFPKRVCKNS